MSYKKCSFIYEKTHSLEVINKRYTYSLKVIPLLYANKKIIYIDESGFN